MRVWLRKRLDAYEGKYDERDDRFARWFVRGVDAIGHRPTLCSSFYFLIGFNLFHWLMVLAFPSVVFSFFAFLDEWSPRASVMAFGWVFGAGVALVYTAFRFKFPGLETHTGPSRSVMAAYSEQRVLDRRFRVWFAAVVGGVVNTLALLVVELLRLYGWH